jgi:hypothetical protein
MAEYKYKENYRTRTRGNHWDEYQIYVSCMESTGLYIKTYDEWLND